MKFIGISIFVALGIVGASLFFTRERGSDVLSQTNQIKNIHNVSIVDGKQIIEIKAKGGYIPESSRAKANIPTILRFNTNGTFDCSSSIRIPSMNISKILPLSGTTDVDLGNPKLGVLQGSCGMGMYPFEIQFN